MFRNVCEVISMRCFSYLSGFILTSVVGMVFFSSLQNGEAASTYYIHPEKGNDASPGVKDKPWKSFAPMNKKQLSPGDRVEIVAAGTLTESLKPSGQGSAQEPIVIHFAPGRYDWQREGLVTHKLSISNTNDDTKGDKAVAMDISGVSHLRIEGKGADFFCRGKMIQVFMDKSRDIVISDIAFDYHRPTMSEFTVVSLADNHAIIRIHPDSPYRLEGNKLIWVGEGWECGSGGYGQVFRPNPDTLLRCSAPLGNVDTVTQLPDGLVKVEFSTNPGLEKGATYQHRDTTRDCAGGFCRDSENIVWDKVKFHYIHGMGVVSQFSKNLTFRNMTIAPREGSGRTCTAWADMLHFSGCAGKITVDGVHFFGSNDDPINIHGTHLRIVESLPPNKVKVRFMHGQTYDIKAFHEGDEVEFVRYKTLRPYASNKVTHAERLDEYEMMLTLEKSVPEGIGENDVMENITWTPSVEIRNCVLDAIPTRGFLLSTRQPIVVENNVFNRTGMHAILVADDAASWYESGPVKNMIIRGNTFNECAEPVIAFHPENQEGNESTPIHSNILIEGNTFKLKGTGALFLKSTDKVVLKNNIFETAQPVTGEVAEKFVSRTFSPPIRSEGNKVITPAKAK